MKVNILGAEYTVYIVPENEAIEMDSYDGFCDETAREITVKRYIRGRTGEKKHLDQQERKNLRHEILHAFLFESGLAENSDWAQNEELIDWFAIQAPKIMKVWQEAEVI